MYKSKYFETELIRSPDHFKLCLVQLRIKSICCEVDAL